MRGFDRDDPALMCEELGDVLLQVLFHTDIERAAGRFTLDDVCDGICKKLIFRHPFLFGSEAAGSWDEIKQQEKGQTTTGETLDAVARSLPALWRSEKLQKKAAKTGFVWESPEEALDKLEGETAELREAIREQRTRRRNWETSCLPPSASLPSCRPTPRKRFTAPARSSSAGSRPWSRPPQKAAVRSRP
jgi:uncharacterized protein YabN with tetrapyrrole methylase and pyrophosphatase domain